MNARDDLWVWMDLEMTGLDADRCHIIEMATLVTDGELRIVAEGPELVIHRTEEELETLSEWSLDHFTRSGLLERVRASQTSHEDALTQTLGFLREHVVQNSAPLCGNSIHHDRLFLRRGMPQLLEHLHYRIIDVSSIKEIARRWYGGRLQPPRKRELHRALADIRESIEELRYYRAALFRDEPLPTDD